MAREKLNSDSRLHISEKDRLTFSGKSLSRGAILIRLWKYMGKNRLLLVLAIILSVTSSLFALYGPKLSGEAINAIAAGKGNVDFDIVFRSVTLMVIFYLLSALLSYLLSAVMIRFSKNISKQMRKIPLFRAKDL